MWAVSLAFLLGILAVQQLRSLPEASAMLILAFMGLLFWRLRLGLLSVLVLGILWASLWGHYLINNRLTEQQAGSYRIDGCIASLPQQQADGQRFELVVHYPDRDFPRKLRLFWPHPPQALAVAQCWQLSAQLLPPHALHNPGGFDYTAWMLANDIGATGVVLNKPEPLMRDWENGLSYRFAIWRQAIAVRMAELLAGEPELGLLQALTIGKQDLISQADWNLFRDTGVTHLVVISGSHIALVAGAVFFLTRRMWIWLAILRISPITVATLAAWFAALGYSGLAGYAIPTGRALMMLSLALAALAWRRSRSWWRLWALALLLMLLFDPVAVLSPGFWLSFIAVALLFYVSLGRLKPPGFWRALTLPQLTTSIGLAPLLLLFFQQLSWVSPLANLLIAPVVGAIVAPLALLGVSLLFVWPQAAQWLLHNVALLLEFLLQVLTLLADLPAAKLLVSPPGLCAVILAGIGALLLLAPRGVPARYLGLVLLLPLTQWQPERPLAGQLWLTMLDVGQGLSVFVQTQTHTLLFDTGLKAASASVAEDTEVTRFLQQQNLARLDKLVISHGDADHSGGASAVMAMLPVTEIYSSARPWAEMWNGQYCQAGQSWQWDSVEFQMLSPPFPAFSRENDNACVLRITVGSDSVLLTADIEQAAEIRLVKDYAEKLRSTVLIAPHHGSSSSSSMLFLERVMPQYVLISAGYHNRFGFPHQQVLDRYSAVHSMVLNTARQGAARVKMGDDGVQVTSEQQMHTHYWLSTD